jgi:predicted nucleic acid-binding protein
MLAPQLIYAECANIVWKKVRRGEMTASEARVASTFIDEFSIETVGMAEIVPLAIDLSLRIDHPAYDCFYLALALLEECPMVTTDESFWRKVRQRLDPGEAERCMTLSALAASR